MKTIPGFPYFRVQFTKDAQVFSGSEVDALKDHLKNARPTDLIVISHGWNNDIPEAEALYEELLSNAADLIAEGKVPRLAGRTFAVMGVLWPSKKFTDKELIPSGAAGIAGTVGSAELKGKLAELGKVFDTPGAAATLGKLASLVGKLDDSDSARKEFVELARSLVRTGAPDKEDGSQGFLSMKPLELFELLSQPISFVAAEAPDTAGGAAGMDPAAGGAAGRGEFFSGPLSGARNLLNYITYYEMKERAGQVGARSVNPILRAILDSPSKPRIHLVGHSFGARLVAATAAGLDDATVLPASSISLLQAAFSHYGFATNWDGEGGKGFFRRAVEGGKIAGPLIITCTSNDEAVGIAYPIASLVAGQNAAGLGDKDSKYGGMGRNGAQKTPEAIDKKMLEAGGSYALQSGKLNNLNADPFIKNHGDVRNRHVAYAVLSAIAAT